MKNILLFSAFFFNYSLFAQSFWSEDFSNGFPVDWVTQDLEQDSVVFEYCNSSDCDVFPKPFSSATASNGFLGVRPPSNFQSFQSQLTTPKIDCSQKNTVFIEFETFIHTWSVSAADGFFLLVKNANSNWESYEILPEQMTGGGTPQFSHNTEKITIDISDMAAGNSEVQIRWQWSGVGEEVLLIDDVQLHEKEPYYDRVVWGHEPGQGDFDGGLNGWAVRSIIPFNDPVKTWQWKNFGQLDEALVSDRISGFSNFPYLNSYSNHNGAMVLNADFFTTGGDTGVQPPYPKYESELISPVIDLSNVQNEVNLRFEQITMLGGQRSTNTSISYSIDDGASWSRPISLSEQFELNEFYRNNPEISMCGLAGQSKVRLKFTFSGNLYFWAIDDIVLIEKVRNDLQVKSNFFAIAPNFQTPVEHLEPIRFWADVENLGISDQKNVWLHSKVTNQFNNEKVFHDSLFLGDIQSCQLVENIFEPTFFFKPPAQQAKYEVQYFLNYDGIDSLAQKNILTWPFETTSNTYAKENGGTTRIEPVTASKDFEYGNVFFIEQGSGFRLDSVTFGIANTRSLSGLRVEIVVYKFFGDNNEDGFANSDEFRIVGLGDYVFTGREEDLTGGIIATSVLDVSDAQPGVKLDGGHYIATVKYQDQTGRACQMLASQDFDYTATYFLYDSLNIPRYSAVERKINDQFDLISLGFDLIPVIRIHVNPISSDLINGITRNQKLTVFPNPATDVLNIENSEKGRLSIYDKNGKSLFTTNVQAEQSINIKEFPVGMYFLKLENEKTVFNGKFLKIE